MTPTEAQRLSEVELEALDGLSLRTLFREVRQERDELARFKEQANLEWMDVTGKLAKAEVEIEERDAQLAEAKRENERLKEALSDPMEEWSFATLVYIARLLLDHNYPAHIFDGSSGDPGPVFVATLRTALDALNTGDGPQTSPPKDSGESSTEFETAMRQWRERGGLNYGPPPLPPCPYCHSYDYGCELGRCRAPKDSGESSTDRATTGVEGAA